MRNFPIIIEALDLKTFEFIGTPIQSSKDLILVAIGNTNDFNTAYVKKEEDAIKLGLHEDIDSGMYVTEELLGNLFKQKWAAFNCGIKFKNIIKKYPKTNIISENKNYTFGVEIETYSGFLPNYVRNKLAVAAHYDGSIRDEFGHKSTGAEYVTDVLYNDAGFKHLNDVFFEISRRCKINNTCSLHVHLGGMSFNKEFIVLMYKLGYIIQDEIFSLMPPSRRNNEYCQKISGKALTKSGSPVHIYGFPNGVKKTPFSVVKQEINTVYENIVAEISLGHKPSLRINKKLNHPNGRFCGYNRSTPRYWWLNFLPSLFTMEEGRLHTFEFRAHSATLNYEKAKNWILICMGIISYAENNSEKILNSPMQPGYISLEEIIRSEYKKKANYLCDYMNTRKLKFNKDGKNAEIIEYDYHENINEECKTIRVI